MVSRETFGPDHFFDLKEVWFADIFADVQFPWEVLKPGLKEAWIQKRLKANVSGVPREGSFVTKTTKIKVGSGEATVEAGSFLVGNDIELREGVVIEGGAWVAGPTILGEGTEIRNGAYVRGGVLTGKKAVVGHTSEAKSSLFLNGAKAPHFAYVGDSILGNKVNLGAGTKVSNLKITGTEIKVRINDEQISTGLRKFGAIIGDFTESGCNSVLNPGTLLAPHCLIYPAIATKPIYFKPKSVVK